jgi:hypothetical protein
MAEAESTERTTEQPQGALARLGQLAWQALPALAGAISLIGFVALIGGAIQWVRFWAAGLPADQAVRAVPEQELVTIGAGSLILFSLAGLLIVLALYLVDSRGNASGKTLRGLFVLAVGEAFVALCLVDLPLWWQSTALGVAFVATGIFAYAALADLPKLLRTRREKTEADDALRAAAREFRAANSRYEDAAYRTRLPPFKAPLTPEREQPRERVPSTDEPLDVPGQLEKGVLVALRQAAVALHSAERDWDDAVDEWIAAAPDKAETKRRRTAARKLRSHRPPTDEALDEACDPPTGDEDEVQTLLRQAGTAFRRVPGSRKLYGAAAVLLLLGVAIPLAVGANEEERLLLAVLAVVVGVTAATFGVAHVTTKFAWYGVSVFASLIAFGAVLNVGLVVRDPLVQPVALVRKGDPRAICGVYVTETDKRIYVGRVEKEESAGGVGADGGAGRMFWVPREEIELVSVGPLMTIPRAQFRALELTGEIQVDRPGKPPAPRASAPGAVAAADEANPLKNKECRHVSLSEMAYDEDARKRAEEREAEGPERAAPLKPADQLEPAD